MPAPKKRRKRTRISRPEVIHDYYGKPLTSTLARSHIVELFTKRPAWNRAALIKAIVEAHSQAGGLPGEASPRQCVCNALGGLKSVGILNNEVIGLWRLVNKAPSMVKHDEQASLDMEIEASPPTASPVTVRAVEVPEGIEIGEGEESVSVFFNPNDQRLAALEGRDRWECRVSQDMDSPQPFSHRPVVGLVIRCEDATEIETILRASLKIAKREIPDALDSGWFYTSPDAVKHWYASFQHSLAQFSNS